MVSVAAINSVGNKRSTSNYGLHTVDLGAPGEQIMSTLPVNTYGSYSGTSMATPHVTGAVALYASTHPAATLPEIRNDLLTSGVRPLAALQGITVTGGTLDASTLMAVLAAPLSTPAAPASLQAALGSQGHVNLTWTDQSDNELGFAIERSTDGQTFALADTVGSNFQTYSDGTVRPGGTYYYRIRAYNAAGTSDSSMAPSPVTTAYVSLPLAPSNLTASASPRTGISLSWADKSNN